MTEKEISEKAEELHNMECLTTGSDHDRDCVKQIDAITAALTAAHRQGREDGIKDAGKRVRLAAGLAAATGGDVKDVWDRATAAIDSLLSQPDGSGGEEERQKCRSELERVVGELRRAIAETSPMTTGLDLAYIQGMSYRNELDLAAFDRRCGELGVKINH